MRLWELFEYVPRLAFLNIFCNKKSPSVSPHSVKVQKPWMIKGKIDQIDLKKKVFTVIRYSIACSHPEHFEYFFFFFNNSQLCLQLDADKTVPGWYERGNKCVKKKKKKSNIFTLQNATVRELWMLQCGNKYRKKASKWPTRGKKIKKTERERRRGATVSYWLLYFGVVYFSFGWMLSQLDYIRASSLDCFSRQWCNELQSSRQPCVEMWKCGCMRSSLKGVADSKVPLFCRIHFSNVFQQ